MLVRASALEAEGGIAAIRGEIIDDCALARVLKPRHPIWLGLTRASRSLRRYDRLSDVWNMVARTAFVQLRRSFVLVAGAVLAMAVVYLVPPSAALVGIATGSAPLLLVGIAAWGMMALAFRPTLRLYDLSPWRGLLLPIAAMLYTLMTIASAWRSLSGRGPRWKDRQYVGGIGTSLEP
jgi:hypothetical protein